MAAVSLQWKQRRHKCRCGNYPYQEIYHESYHGNAKHTKSVENVGMPIVVTQAIQVMVSADMQAGHC